MNQQQRKALKRLALKVQRQTAQVTLTYVVMKDGTVEIINRGEIRWKH